MADLLRCIEGKEHYWNVKQFVPMNRRWGNFRKIIGEIKIVDTPCAIWLMKENDDGRESIQVHNTENGNVVCALGFYWVDSDEGKQKALDKIFRTLMEL